MSEYANYFVNNDPLADRSFISKLSEQEQLLYRLSTGHIETSLTGTALKALYNEVYLGVVAGEIKTIKPIGLKIKSKRVQQGNTVVERNLDCLESISEIARNFEQIIFVGECGNEFASEAFNGLGTTTNVRFKSNTKVVPVLQSNQYLAKSFDEISMIVIVEKNRGYIPMHLNAATLKDACVSENQNTFFPLNSDHSLLTAAKVLPFFGNGIFIRAEDNTDTNLLYKLCNDFIVERGM